MYKLEKLNVVSIVATERQKADLIKDGFKEVIVPVKVEPVKEPVKVEPLKTTTKGKE